MSERDAEPEDKRPICHFTPMSFEFADDWPNGQAVFWECLHCGHTKEIFTDPVGY